MKVPAALLICAAALIPQVSLADAPHTQLEVGMMQGVFDFCSKSAPKNDHRFALKSKELLGNLSDHDRDDIRQNVDFKRGYAMVGSLLAKVPKADAARGCAELFPTHPAQQPPGHKR